MKVLILCTGNSCRSQMAHGFLQSFDKNLEVYSGGTEPAAQVNAKAVEVMKEAGESYGLSEVGEQGYSIAAKTGTAERGDGTNNAWLVTFAPADDPQYIIVANRLKTTEIGKTLAPVVEDLYDTLFDHE